MSPLTNIVFFCVVLGSMVWPAAAHAQWAWRDKTRHNQITYSDRPPPSHIPDSDVIKRPRGPEVAPVPAATSGPAQIRTEIKPAPILLDPKLQAARKEAERQAAEQKQKEEEQMAAARAANCENARTKLRTLESGIRMARTNSKGETEILDDQARQTETKQAQDVIRSECK